MADPYVGEIRLFSFGSVPRGWAACEGQVLPIAQNQALFSILGTSYGGNGSTTFALPDLRGRVAIMNSSNNPLGAKQGEENHTLTVNEMPAHNHMVTASANNAEVWDIATGSTWAKADGCYGASPNTIMSPSAIASTGGNQPHSNMQPYLTVTFGIALQGIFPSRN